MAKQVKQAKVLAKKVKTERFVCYVVLGKVTLAKCKRTGRFVKREDAQKAYDEYLAINAMHLSNKMIKLVLAFALLALLALLVFVVKTSVVSAVVALVASVAALGFKIYDNIQFGKHWVLSSCGKHYVRGKRKPVNWSGVIDKAFLTVIALLYAAFIGLVGAGVYVAEKERDMRKAERTAKYECSVNTDCIQK